MDSVVPPSREKVLEVLRQTGVDGSKFATVVRATAPAGKGKRLTKEAKAIFEGVLRQVLAQLETAGEITNVGTAKSPRYILHEFDQRVDWARATLDGKKTPGRATLYNAAALRKGHRKGVTRTIVEQAVASMVESGRLIEVWPGRSVCYLHVDSILPLIRPDLLPASSTPAERTSGPTPFSPDEIRVAYHVLVQEIGFADVPIADLHGRSGAPMEALKAWLREESRAGRAVPTRGDWSLAGEAARAAALYLRGEPHLQIRLL